jgi:MFS family permease
LTNINSNLISKIVLCFCANVICFMDRVNISIAAPFIMQHYGWSENQMGVIFSAFFVGYVIFMIPGGIVADRYGPRKVLAGGVAFWSLFTFLTPFFPRIWSISMCRFLIGTGQSANYPGINNFIAHQVPPSHRAKVQGFTLSGNMVGAVVGLPVGSWVILTWGWQSIFYLFGILGVVWILFWFYANRREMSDAAQAMEGQLGPIPWKTLLCHRSALGLTGSYFCHNYAAFMFLAWLPTYLMKVHGLSLAATGVGAMVPALAATIFMNLSGWLSDAMIKRGKSLEFSRRILVFIGMGLSGGFLFSVPWLENPYVILTVITISSAARSVSTPIYWALSVDMAPRHAGILSSIMNTAGNVAGIAASALTGWIVGSYGDWNLAIYLGAATTVLGVIIAIPTIRTAEIV